MSDLLCGHWTFFNGNHVARCDLAADHDGMHRHWYAPERNESYSWSDAAERHALSGPKEEQ